MDGSSNPWTESHTVEHSGFIPPSGRQKGVKVWSASVCVHHIRHLGKENRSVNRVFLSVLAGHLSPSLSK